MLITCPECELQVSDKAYSCPHCGLPMKTDKRPYTRKRSTRDHKKLPNGFGQITKLNQQNLRNPYRAMITVGRNANGKPIQKILKPQGYFKTYNDAYAALIEYNRNPYDLEDDMTISQLYDRWSEQYFKSLKSDSSIRTVTSAWAYCSSISNMRVADVRARHIKGVIENGTANIKGEIKTPTANIKSRIKSLFNLMLDYAVEYEVADKNYARTFNLSDYIVQEKEDAKRGHILFSDAEMNILWNNVGSMEYIDTILVQCYGGWRPQELGLIKIENVDLKNGYIIGGMKTAAGINRTVPIHPRIYQLIENRYNQAVAMGSEYLFNCSGSFADRRLTYDKYRNRFNNIINQLNLNKQHRPHDPRKHFISMAKKYEVDEYAIKYIVGHAISDITESVYTDRDKDWLKWEIQKIK